MWTITRTAYKLVWRQSEFAFFVRWLRLAHFFMDSIGVFLYII